MIPTIVGGLISYLAPLLATNAGTTAFSVWDGETPRMDANGLPVGPANTTGSWPAVGLYMQEPGFGRVHTFTDAVHDDGKIVTRVWGTGRAQVETTMGWIEEIFEQQVSVYENVNVGGPPDNPNYVIQMLLDTYGCWEDPDYRLSTSQLLYRGEMTWDCNIHTNAPTTT